MRLKALGLLCIFCLPSCSDLQNIDAVGQRRGDYESYLRENLKVQRLYIKLRETAAAKALQVTPQLTEMQAKVVPGFEAVNKEGVTTFVISLEMPDWSRFNIADFRFMLNGATAKSVREIMDGQLLQTLYPFSVPHDRAFMVDFEGVGTDLKIQTSQGQFHFDFGVN